MLRSIFVGKSKFMDIFIMFRTCGVAVICAILLIVPDLLFSVFHSTFTVTRDLNSLLFIIPVSLGITLNPYMWINVLFISFCAIVQIIQFIHIAYFGTQLSSFALYLMSKEFTDVVNEASVVFLDYIFIIPIVLIPLFLIYKFSKSSVGIKKSIFGTFLIFAVLLFISSQVFLPKFPRFVPNGLRFTMSNSIKSVFGYFALKVRKYNIVDYKPYIIERIENYDKQEGGKKTIVLIIGESVNFKHMSLFGYKYKTTPKLDNLSKNSNFYYTLGISGGINTLTSTKFLTNAIWEADNLKQTSNDATNIFKLAKEAGYKTFYISAQSSHIFASVGGVSYIDCIVTKDNSFIEFKKYKDEQLIKILKNETLSDKNFIVLHQSCIHSPYSNVYSINYKNNKQFQNNELDTINDYDNAMLYNDLIISEMFANFREISNPEDKFYIIWTSDHNELLGEDNLWGHGDGYLHPKVADVPVLIQSNDSDFLNEIKNIFMPTHYELVKAIAKLIGFSIINPNEIDNIFHISGVDYNGKCGYIRGEKILSNKTVQYSNPIYN